MIIFASFLERRPNEESHEVKRDDRPGFILFEGNKEGLAFAAEYLYLSIEAKCDMTVNVRLNFYKLVNKIKRIETLKIDESFLSLY